MVWTAKLSKIATIFVMLIIAFFTVSALNTGSQESFKDYILNNFNKKDLARINQPTILEQLANSNNNNNQLKVPEHQKQNAYNQILQELEKSETIDILVWLNQNQDIEDVLEDFPEANIKHIYEAIGGFALTSADLKLINQLTKDKRVSYITFDEEIKGHLFQSRPLIQADLVESNLGITGQGIGVCHLDTGINYNHANLAHAYVSGYDFVNMDNDPMDDHGHGTATVGTIASNQPLFTGISPNASIFAVKVLNSSGTGVSSDVAAGINWCVANKNNMGINLLSMSLGTTNTYDPSNSPATYGPALINAYNENMIAIASAGNQGVLNALSYPSVSPYTISVGATYNGNQGSRTYTFGSFTCTDPTTQADQITCFSNRASFLDLMAPGAIISTTSLAGSFSSQAGTSMSVPHITGTTALMLERNPNLLQSQIKDILTSTGTQIIDPSTGLTFQRVDALAAVQATPYLEVLGSLTPGTTITFNINAPGENGNAYILALSTSNSPGIPLIYRTIPIFDDNFLFPITINTPTLIGLQNSQGTIVNNGNQASIVIPNFPGVQTMDIYSAFVTIDPSLPFPVATVSNSVKL